MLDVKTLKNMPICYIHSMIQDKCTELINSDDLSSDQILEIADDILQLSFIAEEQGYKMENRLREYRESIEKLGFERHK